MSAKTSKSKTKTEAGGGWLELDEDVKFVRGLWRLDRALGMNTVIVADSYPVKPLETSDGAGKLTPRHVAIFSSDMEWAFCLNFNAEDGSRCENVSKGKNIAGFRVERFYEDKIGPKLVQFLAGREEQTQRAGTNDVVQEIILKRLKSVAEPKFKSRMTEQEFSAALDERDRLIQTASDALKRYAPRSCLGKMFRPEFNGAKPRDSWQLRNGKAVEKDEVGLETPEKLGRGRLRGLHRSRGTDGQTDQPEGDDRWLAIKKIAKFFKNRSASRIQPPPRLRHPLPRQPQAMLGWLRFIGGAGEGRWLDRGRRGRGYRLGRLAGHNIGGDSWLPRVTA